MVLALRLLPLLLLIGVCVSVLSQDREHDTQAAPAVAADVDRAAVISAQGASATRLAGVLRAASRPFESWAPAGSGNTAPVSMRVITLGLRN